MAQLNIWIEAFRLKTLPLALSASIMGSFLAYSEDAFSVEVLIFAVLTTLFLQILSNLANDYGDAKKGSDNEDRIGPRRVTQSGLVSHRQIRRMIILFVILSLVSGILLIWYGIGNESFLLALLFLALGIAAIYAAMKYTMGKRPYGYVGLGDIMVFVFFGLVGVGGTYFLHSATLPAGILLPASSLGLFSAGVLNLNNMRDRESDAKSGKNTLVVRMGIKRAKAYHVFLLLAALMLALIYTLLHFSSYWQLLFLLPVPLFFSGIRTVVKNSVPAELYPELKKLSLQTLIFTILFGLGLIL